jgi:hypothetical protein
MSRTIGEVCTDQQLRPQMVQAESHQEETLGLEAGVGDLPLAEEDRRNSEERRPSENLETNEKTEVDLDRHRLCHQENHHHRDPHLEEGLHPPIDPEDPPLLQEAEIAKRLANSSSLEIAPTTVVHSYMLAKAAGEDPPLEEQLHRPLLKRGTERIESRDQHPRPMCAIYTRKVYAHAATNASSSVSILRRQEPSRRQKQRRRVVALPLPYAFVFL